MIEITRAQHTDELSGDLGEVCELHARGQMVEVIAVPTGFVIAVGRIDGANAFSEDCHNVSHIGGGYTFRDDAKFYHSLELAVAMKFAMSEFMKFELVDAV